MTTSPGAGVEPAAPPQRHFTHLLASARHRRRAWTSPSALISVVSHAALISALLWVNLRAPAAAEATEEIVTFLNIQPEPKDEPEPEAPKPPPVQSEAPPLPKGTQTLLPPDEPPLEIPAVDLSAPAVSADDFSGTGVVGGVADGVVGAPLPETPAAESAAEHAFEVAVLDRKPELTNAAAVAVVIERLYPKILKQAGIGGMVTLEFVIETDGTVDPQSVKVTESPNELLSDASTLALERFRFKPGRYQGRDVRVLIVMPISWVPPR